MSDDNNRMSRLLQHLPRMGLHNRELIMRARNDLDEHLFERHQESLGVPFLKEQGDHVKLQMYDLEGIQTPEDYAQRLRPFVENQKMIMAEEYGDEWLENAERSAMEQDAQSSFKVRSIEDLKKMYHRKVK